MSKNLIDADIKISVPALKAEIKRLESEIRAGKAEAKDKQRAYSKVLQDELNKPAKDRHPFLYALFYEYERKNGPVPHSPKAWIWTQRNRVTNLYKLRAHMRGRLHASVRKRLNEYGVVKREKISMFDQESEVKAFIKELVEDEDEIISKGD